MRKYIYVNGISFIAMALLCFASTYDNLPKKKVLSVVAKEDKLFVDKQKQKVFNDTLKKEVEILKRKREKKGDSNVVKRLISRYKP